MQARRMPFAADTAHQSCHRNGTPRTNTPRVPAWVTEMAGLLTSASSLLSRLPEDQVLSGIVKKSSAVTVAGAVAGWLHGSVTTFPF